MRPGLRLLDWGSLPRGDDGARVGQCSVAIAGQWCQVEGEAAHRQIGLAVAWSARRVAGGKRLQA
ncbi:hypothetical protein [Candidatus Accumulibacter contiguus]|uniref:hypothetical protein n=1 Tax=Candidatus Accumulibacter contiguus TaxID=2954381 RepID=UPI002FC2FA95